MSKSSSKDLFLLIKSLSKSEKRYFKLYASRHRTEEENHYVKLFDAIAKQEEYDEETILKKETYINSLTQLKGRLYDAILKSLEMFHSEGSDTFQVRSLLNYAEMLYSKNLIAQALKVLQKAKVIAEKNEEFTYQLEISRMESRIYTQTVDSDWLNKGVDASMEYEKDAMQKFSNLQQYRTFGAKMSLWSQRRNELRAASELEELRSLEGYSLLSDEKNALSDSARLRHYHFNALLVRLSQSVEESFGYFKKMKDLLDANPDMKKKSVLEYMIALYNMTVVSSDKAFSFEERMALADQMKDLVETAPDKEPELMTRYAMMRLHTTLFHGKHKEAYEAAEETAAWLSTQKLVKKPFDMGIYYHLSYIYFINKSYKKSLQWLNRIINATEKEALFFHAPAQIFSMIVHYELDNREFLDYNVRSVYRYLYRRNRLYKLESSVLDFIRLSMPRANNRNEMIEAFRGLKEALEKLAEDPFEKNAFGYFDFIAWLESKVENKEFGQVLLEKATYLGRNSRA